MKGLEGQHVGWRLVCYFSLYTVYIYIYVVPNSAGMYPSTCTAGAEPHVLKNMCFGVDRKTVWDRQHTMFQRFQSVFCKVSWKQCRFKKK